MAAQNVSVSPVEAEAVLRLTEELASRADRLATAVAKSPVDRMLEGETSAVFDTLRSLQEAGVDIYSG